MNPGATILTEIEDYIERENLTISKFAERSGMHSGTLSNIINGNRPIAMQQLDKITQAMGMNDGYFYDLYIECYIINGAADWRRIGPLLLRCAELNKLEAIHRVVSNILDNLFYLPMLFDTAEELFTQQKYTAAEIIYKSVAEGERFQHSERLALCHYRLFHIALGDNQETNLHAANQFQPYVERLDEADQLDAIKQLVDVYASLHQWNKAECLAELMRQKATIQYQYYNKKDTAQKQPSRTLIFYILYAFLMQSLIADETGKFDRAMYFASLYADMSWVKTPYSDDEIVVMEQFKEWSVANMYLYRLMAGDQEVIPEYIGYVETRKNEISHALYRIIQAANRYYFNVDDILEKFSRHLSYGEQVSRLGKYKGQQVTQERRIRFFKELAVYHFNQEKFDLAFKYLLESLESSVKICSETNILKCVGLFEKYRYAALPEYVKKYTNSISEVQKINEEGNFLASKY
ncbi:helix-turn-helix domain-containing protein [Paenibacillus tengchongensis]|uniref:helix-turn-helix domain-containing protein n=1 Tax=Paenibacillus tengchongensis TaxID=2608684 RepID=UPI00124EA07D|nr:helix-turn-helix transcriptional regulator [Paenibacillus tengchongensis]